MTVRKRVLEHLENKGMFLDEAKAVMDSLEQQYEPMRGRWADDESEYPAQMIPLVLITADHEALKWIDANAPQAWYRPLFEAA